MLLRESGADHKSTQERLRHTKIGTMADIYMGESDLISRDAADRFMYEKLPQGLPHRKGSRLPVSKNAQRKNPCATRVSRVYSY